MYSMNAASSWNDLQLVTVKHVNSVLKSQTYWPRQGIPLLGRSPSNWVDHNFLLHQFYILLRGCRQGFDALAFVQPKLCNIPAVFG